MNLKIKRLFYNIWVWFGIVLLGWKKISGYDYGHAVGDGDAEVRGYMDRDGIHHIKFVVHKTKSAK